MLKVEAKQLNQYEIANRLGDAWKKTPKVMADSINDTLKDMKKLLYERVIQIYAIQRTRFDKAWKKSKNTYNAKPSDLRGQLVARGSKLGLIDFTTKPKERVLPQPEYYQGKVLTKNSLKNLSVDGRKMFIATMPTGHTGVFVRKNNETNNIREIFAQSLATMLGNEKEVYGYIEPKVGELLNNNVERRIKKVLEKK